MDDALGAPVARATGSDPDFAVFGDDCLLKFRLSTYVAPGAAGMYKSNNVRVFVIDATGCGRFRVLGG